ncbi:MAG: acyl-CoA dehydrogenase family protein [Planctomycetota bacterium]
MWDDLSDRHKQVRETARRFADEVLAPRAARLDAEHTYPREEMRGLAKLGFLGMLVPEALGGSALGNQGLVLVLEEVNRACASTGVTMSVHNSLASGPIVRFGNDAQKAKYLPRLASGEWTGAYSLTEPGSGSDAASLIATAVRDGDHYVLNGTKVFVTTGGVADLVIIFARTNRDPSARAKGVSCFIVEAGWKGFRAGRPEEKLGIRASNTVTLYLEDLRVPVENLLGEEGKGFNIAMDTLDGGRIGIATQGLGIARACLEECLRLVKGASAGGEMRESGAVTGRIAEIATDVDAARLLIHRAATLRDRKLPHGKEAAMAKLFASQLANRAAREAVQIAGMAGYVGASPVERFLRDARITEIYEGTTEIQKLVIARSLMKD